MKLFRKAADTPPASSSPAREPDVPDGMVAVPLEELAEVVRKLLTAADEMGATQETPEYVDLYAKVALREICGEERFRSGLSAGALQLGYNLVRGGYWCRAAEMQAISEPDVSPAVTEFLREVHAHAETDWWGALIGAARYFSTPDSLSDPAIQAVRSAMPPDFGEDFRARFGAAACAVTVQAVEAQWPAAAEPLDASELLQCWIRGYWIRALAVSLPSEAHRELAEQE